MATSGATCGCLLYTGRGGTLNTPSKDANGSQYLTWGLWLSWLPWQQQGSHSPKVERGPWEIAYLSESSVTLAQERGIPALSPRSLQADLEGRSGYHAVFLLQLKCFHSVLQMVLEAVPEPLR